MLPSMDMGSKMPNCLRTAMNSSTTTAMAHSSIPWMPMASAAGTGAHPSVVRSLEVPGRSLPPGLRGGGSHAPGRRGYGYWWGQDPAEEKATVSRTGRDAGARAQLCKSATKLRGAAAAAAWDADPGISVSQQRLHSPHGAPRLCRPLSCHEGSGPHRRGVPGAPGRPRFHRGSLRAHWPRRRDHSGTCPLRPLLASPGRGGRDEAPPHTV